MIQYHCWEVGHCSQAADIHDDNIINNIVRLVISRSEGVKGSLKLKEFYGYRILKAKNNACYCTILAKY